MYSIYVGISRSLDESGSVRQHMGSCDIKTGSQSQSHKKKTNVILSSLFSSVAGQVGDEVQKQWGGEPGQWGSWGFTGRP